ncbi:hypothetical protein [Vibrio parahaemolyticus]|uniref:hypothetical protein n=1 Tax=Vibrio parahaemolyticus TaxID=670 RepID=UPI0011245E51|nr:hypothetical protein [Vibrio parahaemolyticus]TPA00380.1 hypothetical protein DXE04_02900 [Vibrio parahaemolyticus]
MNNALHCPSLCSASKTAIGEALKLHDAEMKILASGPMGMQRLATMRALDLQENIPGLSNEDAQKMGAGYVWRITAIETSIRGWKRFVKAMRNKLFLDRREVC